MSKDRLKQLASCAAADYLAAHLSPGTVLGVGTGSTVHCFIDALAPLKGFLSGAVSSSQASTAQLIAHGIKVFDPNDIDVLPIYVDGADEIDGNGRMIKGGGGALTGEKIIAAMADVFVCIVDASKQVAKLGAFPLPIEVMPMARAAVSRRLAALGGAPSLRVADDGRPYLTDHGNPIIDVRGLPIDDPLELEAQLNNWPGVVTVGLFAQRSADLCLIGTANGVRRIDYCTG